MQRHVTVVKQVVPYRDDSGLAHVIVSFESNDLNAMDELHLGRFFGADMSLALFTYRGTQWVLDNFSLVTGRYGTFHTVPDITVIRLGNNNYGCTIGETIYYPGGPGYLHYHVYAPHGHRFKKVLGITGAAKYFTGPEQTSWRTDMKLQHDSMQYADISVVTVGKFCREGSGNDTDIDLPSMVQYMAATADSFGFKVTRQFQFTDSAYHLKRTRRRFYGVLRRKSKVL